MNDLIRTDPTSTYELGDTQLLQLYLKDIMSTTVATLMNRDKLTESLTYTASGGKGIVKEFMQSGGFWVLLIEPDIM